MRDWRRQPSHLSFLLPCRANANWNRAPMVPKLNLRTFPERRSQDSNGVLDTVNQIDPYSASAVVQC